MKMAWFLGSVFVFFCLVLIVCYGITKQAHPVFVDVNGNPTNAVSASK
jgi:uncharacterized membrane protein